MQCTGALNKIFGHQFMNIAVNGFSCYPDIERPISLNYRPFDNGSLWVTRLKTTDSSVGGDFVTGRVFDLVKGNLYPFFIPETLIFLSLG